ncbi:right-handed parallel beta-helix repeat-containing protein [Thalassotalea sp. Y01]|uniref:right-handed parallel beta-helix repeat-containing protein n=1 Tax=Thalassotalea sp. Y01 TaxID=2729613 RepID=UPI00145FB9D4|nr:right-handed parallel beta-helix repeat-containing protein [Thalassotalea sp. Y01]NMP16182.1 hypothetical protein [Thalassotalea sp. Y01]
MLFMRNFAIILLCSMACHTGKAYGTDTPPLCEPEPKHQQTYYVALDGHDYKGKGTINNPWRNIAFAVFKAQDDSLIVVRPGVYEGPVKISKTFKKGITIKSEVPYGAKLTAQKRVLALVKAAANIRIQGFEISHKGPGARPVVVHIDAWGTENVHGISLVNNIIHDSYNNDLLKINYGAHNILINCNMFYNQGNSDEHIDINSVADVHVRHNVFFNDFPASNREITKKSSSYIVIKDSNNEDDRFFGSTNINIDGNIFFNWQGSHGHGFILVGEDGKPYFEAEDINIFNNLLIGNSKISMRSPFAVKGAHKINFDYNTVIGDLPSNAYALRVSVEGNNKVPTDINMRYNIYSDATGTMGSGDYQMSNDFTDTEYGDVDDYLLSNNIVFNGEKGAPYSLLDVVNASDDDDLREFDTGITLQQTLVSPIYLSKSKSFADGSTSIEQVFKKIINDLTPPKQPQKLALDESKAVPLHDILGRPRTPPYSIGAIEYEENK